MFDLAKFRLRRDDKTGWMIWLGLIVVLWSALLALMNHAYVLRQMQSDFQDNSGTKSYITSLKPLNPNNVPDAWEAKARGIGLGLVVVKNLTEANGGTVVVQSEVDKGTVFAITLPGADEMGGSI